MDLRERTFFPLEIWFQQKVGAAELGLDGATLARFLLPPADKWVQAIRRACPIEPKELLSPSFRRRLRQAAKARILLEYPPQMLATLRKVFVEWRQKSEEQGYHFDASRLGHIRDIEQEINQGFTQLAENPSELTPISPVGRADEVTSLLWEWAHYGEGETRPKLRSNSKIWDIFGIDPKQVQDLTDDEALKLGVSLVANLFELAEQQPARLISLIKEFVKIHLPIEQEPPTSPEALSNAAEVGIIHRGLVVKDKKTGEVVDVDVEDRSATRFIQQLEDKDEAREEFDRIVSRVELSPSERLVLQGMRNGLRGEELAEWAAAQEGGPGKASVPVLASKVMAKLRRAAKT